MSNDNKKTKNNAPCEEKQEARQLTEEELEQVTGGSSIVPLPLYTVGATVINPDFTPVEASRR